MTDRELLAEAEDVLSRCVMVRRGAVADLAQRFDLSSTAAVVLHELVDAADWRTGTVHAFTVTDWADVLRTSRRRLTAALLELEGAGLVSLELVRGHEGTVHVLAYYELTAIEEALRDLLGPHAPTLEALRAHDEAVNRRSAMRVLPGSS